VGTETASPVVSSEVFYSGFGNEGGADGRSFLAVNITGLWILQRCREKWAQYAGREISWEEIVRGALSAPRFRSFIDVDHSSFGASPADMPGVIGDYCGDKGIRRPAGMGETARCVFESLVMKFRWRLEQLERLTSIRAGVVHLVGGGVRNEPLCQWTADATGKRVIAGPVETTVAGNLIMQMKGSGEIVDLEEGRRIVAASSETREYAPKDAASWEEAFVVYAAAIR
jgi:sugar (pentulose or hexulose) kinase